MTTPTASAAAAARLSMTQVLLCGAGIVTLSMGIRHGFGLWMQPITMERGWTREDFAFAMALQNLAWGLAGPFAGMFADRFGAFRVLMVGAVLYALGLVGMGLSATTGGFVGTAGLLIGIALAGTTYAVVYGVIGRQVAPEKRSWAMGVTASAGSFGQFLMLPLQNGLISTFGWQDALLILACASLAMLPLAFGLREPMPSNAPASIASGPSGVGAAMREAFAYRPFQLLTAGYFVCGFHLAFIGIHLPSYLKDHGLGPEVATWALALIGLFNVFGTYGAGVLGQHFLKARILAVIYALRALTIALFVLVPLSAWTVYLFAAMMGLLWLSTVPATNGIVAQVFGVRHLSMLSGFVFLSHQVGSFMGVWLGGGLYEATGSYTVMWWLAVALGLFSALINLPVREGPIPRGGVAPQPAGA